MKRTLSKAEMHVALAGKALERGLSFEDAGDLLYIKYEEPTDQRMDHLHKQAIRNLADRLEENVPVHLSTIKTGLGGFIVDVTPASSRQQNGQPSTEDALKQIVELLQDALKVKAA